MQEIGTIPRLTCTYAVRARAMIPRGVVRCVSSGRRDHGPPPPYIRRRVVVTGIGIVSPLGIGRELTWQSLLHNATGIQALRHPDATAFPSQVAGHVLRATSGGYDASHVVDRGSARTATPDYIGFALAAGREALIDAALLPRASADTPCGSPDGPLAAALFRGPYLPSRAGVSVGSGIGGIEEVGAVAGTLLGPDQGRVTEAAMRKVSPFFVPRILSNMAAGGVALAFGLRGPNLAPATACASGAHAIGDAGRAIALGQADMMLAGGSEACIGPIALAGFSRPKALSTGYNDRPGQASRPFDTGRDGFVLGEGSAVLVLEEAEAARARGARVYAELRGYGSSCDAHHVTSPSEDGSGALACMTAALADAGLPASSLGYINAHATSTPMGDAVEATAIGRLLGSDITRQRLAGMKGRVGGGGGAEGPQAGAAGLRPGQGQAMPLVSSTKGAVGHLLGAAGAIEAAFSVLSLCTGRVPATVNLTDRDPSLPLDVAKFPAPGDDTAWPQGATAAMSNSFGFGGTNSCLVFARPPQGTDARTGPAD